MRWKRSTVLGAAPIFEQQFEAVANYVTGHNYTSTVEIGAGSKDGSLVTDMLMAAKIDRLNGESWASIWHDNASIEKYKEVSLATTQYLVDAVSRRVARVPRPLGACYPSAASFKIHITPLANSPTHPPTLPPAGRADD